MEMDAINCTRLVAARLQKTELDDKNIRWGASGERVWGDNVLSGAAAERCNKVLHDKQKVIHPQGWLQHERAIDLNPDNKLATALVFVKVHNDMIHAAEMGGFSLLDDNIPPLLLENAAFHKFNEMSSIGPWIDAKGVLKWDFVTGMGFKGAWNACGTATRPKQRTSSARATCSTQRACCALQGITSWATHPKTHISSMRATCSTRRACCASQRITSWATSGARWRATRPKTRSSSARATCSTTRACCAAQRIASWPRRGGRRWHKSAEPLQWMRIIRIYAPLHYAKVVRQSDGRQGKPECSTIVTIQSDQDWKDRSRNKCRGFGCTCARNATGRRRSAQRLTAWRQHAATTSSCYANISTRRLFGNSLISSKSLFSSSSRAEVRHTAAGLPDDF